MQSPNETELHSHLWQRFQTNNAKLRLPHALLLIGSETANLVDFAYAMAASILCQHEKNHCKVCKSCHLNQLKEHPDLCYLEPDKTGGQIKIDQIRDLHNLAFRSPQLGDRRIFILYPAEKMNVAAANALLKLLEEPPSGVFFILIAEQISSLPATIISRCQLWRFPQANDLDSDYLTVAKNCKTSSGTGLLFQQLPLLIEGLTELLTHKISGCSLAVKWSTYDFDHLVWLLYLVNCQLIYYKLNGSRNKEIWTEQLQLLAAHFQPFHLFQQLDQLNAIIKNLRRNINVNQLLVLENLLLGYAKII
ncbi:MAG: hypothetical protein H0T84_11015 [Tatlockia sp.]|nr:hypothetical protein [Tatlockia sp.]